MALTAMSSSLLTAAEILAVAIFLALDRLNVLPRRKRSADAAGELEIADRTIDRLRGERNQERARADKLEHTRSLEPILDQIAANAELQAQVLDRLVHHNGSFKHMEESLREIGEGLKLITGFIAGVVDIPLKEKP